MQGWTDNWTPDKVKDWALGDDLRAGQSAQYQPMVAAIGNFDGVHLGHQHLINQAKLAAGDKGLPLGILTFTPHPLAYFRPDDAPFLLMDRQAKSEALIAAGADFIVHIAFDPMLQACEAGDFVSQVLQPLGVKHLFAGTNFAYGHERGGDMTALKALAGAHDIDVTALALLADEHAAILSSTRIRAALQSAQVELAAAMLGHDPVISGVVVGGDQRGRLLSFPTANIMLNDVLAPAFGVYAIEAQLGVPATGPQAPKLRLQGVANIGIRPTVNDRGLLGEVHLFDFDRDIYGMRLTVYLKSFIRAEKKFGGLDELQAQIAKDAQSARSLLPPPLLTA